MPRQVHRPSQSVCAGFFAPANVSLTFSIEERAKIPVRLAIGDIGGISGRYWANDSVASAADGKVQDW